jgi:predicted patatin/cPLA2 family phospholipase
MTALPSHPVLDVLAARRARGEHAGGPGRWDDGALVALAVEGGGMRGAVTGGMVLVIAELGLTPFLDGIWGSSSGALAGSWLLTGAAEQGMRPYLDPRIVRTVIAPRRALRGGPLVDVALLLDRVYPGLLPGFFEQVFAHPVPLHPLATDVDTGAWVDLGPTITSPDSLHAALRASSGLPVIGGPPVMLGGRRYVDAGVATAIPIDAPVAAGATHVLLLRSRRAGQRTQPVSRAGRLVAGPLMRRVSPALEREYLGRFARESAQEDDLDAHEAHPERPPCILQIRPGPEVPDVGRLERDVARVRPALEGGRRAARAALAPLA